jgi:tRNA (guanine-N7-)-methyltransferase
LAHQAELFPDINFIGAEPFHNGVAKLLALIEEKAIGNIRIHDDDVRYLLERLPPACLTRIYVLYPDPWPKKRHHERRIVSADTLKQFHALLKPDGIFLFASDIDDYIEWTLRECSEHGGFELVSNSSEPLENWIQTRYEAKAKREGRESRYLTFHRS